MNNIRSGLGLADVLANAIYDELRGRPDAKSRMIAELDTLGTRMEKLHQAIAADRAKRAARSQLLPLPLSAYAGEYVNPDWGTIRLSVREGHLEADMGVAHSTVEVYDDATQKLRVELFGGGGVVEMVVLEGAGSATELRLEGASFTRR